LQIQNWSFQPLFRPRETISSVKWTNFSASSILCLMNLRRAGMILAFCILGVCAVYAILSPPGSVSYSRFTSRTPDYYSNLVGACELLLETAPKGIEYRHTFAGTDARLPYIIWELRPARVEILSRGKLFNSTNLLTFVRIYMGRPREDYSIFWGSTGDDPSLWELEAADEGHDKILMAVKKASEMKMPTQPPGGNQ